MSFSATQIRKLQRGVKTCDIRTREVNGRELSYIEGWHAISEANRIFGFDGWNRETIETRCVLARDNRGTHHVVYVAKVRITVRAETETVVREGFGTGEAQGGTAGEAHEKAIKTAETDATKRAFATFGKPFGLALYISTKRPKPAKETPDIERRRTLQKVGPNGRYYVPSWKPTQLDPTIKAITQPLQTAPNTSPAPATDSTKPVQLDGAGHDTSIAPSHILAPISPTDSRSASVFKTDYPLLIDRPTRRRDADHLRFVASQPCLICSRTPSDAHHLKFAQPKAMARKVSDEFTVPLCRTHHRQLHHGGDEVSWWNDMDVDPLPIAQDLWEQSHNQQLAMHQRLLKGTSNDE
jgi:hypothetical protein